MRAHIEQTRPLDPSADPAESSWEGVLLDPAPVANVVADLVGLYSLRFANGKAADIVVRVDGSFVGVGPCPVQMW